MKPTLNPTKWGLVRDSSGFKTTTNDERQKCLYHDDKTESFSNDDQRREAEGPLQRRKNRTMREIRREFSS